MGSVDCGEEEGTEHTRGERGEVQLAEDLGEDFLWERFQGSGASLEELGAFLERVDLLHVRMERGTAAKPAVVEV